MNVRAVAAQVIYQVVDQGQSLSALLPQAQQRISPKDSGLLFEICYGVLRWLPRLEATAQQLMEKPLVKQSRVAHHLILVGLYQLGHMRVPAHAVVDETVKATADLKKPQLRGLINAVLRNYQRNQEALDLTAQSHDAGKYCHPSWLLKQLKESYPDHWQEIITANNSKAPMWLRVNRKHSTKENYQSLLTEAGIDFESVENAPDDAIKLQKAVDVYALPHFEDGWVSVQDAAAQLAVDYLKPQANELILDCCSAPGSKTCHILEHQPTARVISVDIDSQRLKRVEQNLQRLQLNAEVICGDARYPEQWWSNEQFDRILLDAPCSATGVIRRHPDIKWLRRASDIDQLAALQAEILNAMWAKLKVGGTLVYATCSILEQENKQQISAFLAKTSDAMLLTGTPENAGIQILPSQQDMDGFYYAVLQKTAM